MSEFISEGADQHIVVCPETKASRIGNSRFPRSIFNEWKIFSKILIFTQEFFYNKKIACN